MALPHSIAEDADAGGLLSPRGIDNAVASIVMVVIAARFMCESPSPSLSFVSRLSPLEGCYGRFAVH